MYRWRSMSQHERDEALKLRRGRKLPWHSPPHLDFEVERQYLLSASCYEHASVVGKNPERMTECESEVLEICRDFSTLIYAWCFLPNHYHVLLRTDRIKALRKAIGLFNGRSSYRWNNEDGQRGRKVWYNCFERPMKSKRHFLATLNYVHNNAVYHGYVKQWQDWPWCSAAAYLQQVGHEKAKELWLKYPILNYGKKWDR